MTNKRQRKTRTRSKSAVALFTTVVAGACAPGMVNSGTPGTSTRDISSNCDMVATPMSYEARNCVNAVTAFEEAMYMGLQKAIAPRGLVSGISRHLDLVDDVTRALSSPECRDSEKREYEALVGLPHGSASYITQENARRISEFFKAQADCADVVLRVPTLEDVEAADNFVRDLRRFRSSMNKFANEFGSQRMNNATRNGPRLLPGGGGNGM